MARTIVNGVSNNARVETIVQNSDAIDGVKFVGTLDGKTCPYCAFYDGYIWRGEEIAEARRPPIHPNCRCCLIPYIELKDDEGNVVDVDGERPAANADFDKLAQDAYNERAREKGWKRRWDDLSPSTRLKYYYQAQKDFEAETGKPAYRQVSGATTFQEYFHRQPDSFKRAWLGAKRYELYKAGKLKEKNIFKPDLTYQVSAESLVRDEGISPLQIKSNTYSLSIEDAFNKIGKRFSEIFQPIKSKLPKPELYPEGEREEERERLFARSHLIALISEEAEPVTLAESESQMLRILGEKDVSVDYRGTKKPVDIEYANTINREFARFLSIFGDTGMVRHVRFVDDLGRDEAQYEPDKLRISFKNQSLTILQKKIEKESARGFWKSKKVSDIIWHELGHPFYEYLRYFDRNGELRVQYAVRLAEEYEVAGIWSRSEYGKRELHEFVAELMAERSDNPVGREVGYMIRILTRDDFIMEFNEAKNEILRR